MKKHPLILSLAVLILFGCKKNETNLIETKLESSTNQTFSSSDYYKNPNNEFDYVGQYHNEGIDFLKTFINETDTFAFDFLIDTSSYFEAQITGEDYNEIKSEAESALNQLTTTVGAQNQTFKSGLYAMIDSWSTSNQCKLYGYSLLNTVFNNSYNNFDSIIYPVLQIEGGILSDSLLIDDEKEQLLKISSLMRHSAYYWKQNPASSIEGNVAIPPKWKKFWDKVTGWFEDHEKEVEVVACDVAILLFTWQVGGWLPAGVASYQAILIL